MTGYGNLAANARPFEQIVQITQDLMAQRAPLIKRMNDVAQRYSGEIVVPIPNVPDEPVMPNVIPLLMGEAIDFAGRQACSVTPAVSSPAMIPHKDQGPGSREYAMIRRRIIAATYHASKWKLGRRRFNRHVAGYGTGAITVLPDPRLNLPKVRVADPLGVYADPRAADNFDPPEFVAIVRAYSGAWLRTRFPESQIERGGVISQQLETQLWDVVEWHDCEQVTFGIIGPKWGAENQWLQSQTTGRTWMPLGAPMPNKAGMCLAIVPENITMTKLDVRMAALIPSIDLQGKLLALDIIAQEKAIFPDMYVVGSTGQQPKIVGGRWKDGREGDINKLFDVDKIGVVNSTPDPRTQQLVDRLERNTRISSGFVPQAGGESYGALRTGRGLDALMGASIDPRIQEVHELEESWMPHVNKAIFGVYRKWYGSRSYSLYSGWANDDRRVEFTPNEHIETDENTVSFPVAGADAIQTTQILGSLAGAGMMSVETARSKHPMIDDPEAERDKINAEQLEDAMRASISQQLASGQMPLTVGSRIHELMTEGKSVFAAVKAADQELREKQAAEAPPPEQGQIAPPPTMPGLAAGPTADMAAQPPQRVEVPDDVTAMNQLMAAMGGGY